MRSKAEAIESIDKILLKFEYKDLLEIKADIKQKLKEKQEEEERKKYFDKDIFGNDIILPF